MLYAWPTPQSRVSVLGFCRPPPATCLNLHPKCLPPAACPCPLIPVRTLAPGSLSFLGSAVTAFPLHQPPPPPSRAWLPSDPRVLQETLAQPSQVSQGTCTGAWALMSWPPSRGSCHSRLPAETTTPPWWQSPDRKPQSEGAILPHPTPGLEAWLHPLGHSEAFYQKQAEALFPQESDWFYILLKIFLVL